MIARLAGPTGGWKRRVAIWGSMLAVAAGIALAEGKPSTSGLKPQSIDVVSRPIPGFDKEKPGRTRFGRLEWRGGVVLSSSNTNFGGWSGLQVSPAGDKLMAVSDGGTWLTADISYDKGRISGLKRTRLGPLLAANKTVLARNRDRDAEGIALLEGSLDNGTALISFEQNDRIGRFAIGASGIAAPAGYISIPKEMKRVRSNDGFEALTALRDGPHKGSLVAFAEKLLPGEKNHAGWIWIGGQPKRISLADDGGFDLTDVAAMDDGGLLFLERRFRWSEGVKMRLRLVSAGEIKPGALLKGEVLLEADLNSEIDNMEGLGVHKAANGETVLTLISDDNFNSFLQRTLLIQFALDAGAQQETARDSRPASPAAASR